MSFFSLFISLCSFDSLSSFSVSGHGVAQDFGSALAWYKQSSDQNYPPAINSLATMYREGKGTPKDLPLAIDWYKKAAALNNLDAINNLGQMHEAGEGITKNLEVTTSNGRQRDTRQRGGEERRQNQLSR